MFQQAGAEQDFGAGRNHLHDERRDDVDDVGGAGVDQDGRQDCEDGEKRDEKRVGCAFGDGKTIVLIGGDQGAAEQPVKLGGHTGIDDKLAVSAGGKAHVGRGCKCRVPRCANAIRHG